MFDYKDKEIEYIINNLKDLFENLEVYKEYLFSSFSKEVNLQFTNNTFVSTFLPLFPLAMRLFIHNENIENIVKLVRQTRSRELDLSKTSQHHGIQHIDAHIDRGLQSYRDHDLQYSFVKLSALYDSDPSYFSGHFLSPVKYGENRGSCPPVNGRRGYIR